MIKEYTYFKGLNLNKVIVITITISAVNYLISA